jgi:hypothetical protein
MGVNPYEEGAPDASDYQTGKKPMEGLEEFGDIAADPRGDDDLIELIGDTELQNALDSMAKPKRQLTAQQIAHQQAYAKRLRLAEQLGATYLIALNEIGGDFTVVTYRTREGDYRTVIRGYRDSKDFGFADAELWNEALQNHQHAIDYTLDDLIPDLED